MDVDDVMECRDCSLGCPAALVNHFLNDLNCLSHGMQIQCGDGRCASTKDYENL